MITLNDLIVSPEDNLRSAMERMTQNKKGLLFVCDASNRLSGVLSDGDVRRMLLTGVIMNAPVSQAMNTDPVSARDEKEAEKILHKMGVIAVPVVDAEGRLNAALLFENEKFHVLKSPAAEKPSRKKLSAFSLIPARGESKRIPRKNIAPVGGKPLIAWAIQAAKASRHASRTLVSTDDAEIAEIAKRFGGEAPWLRPKELAGDKSTTLEAVLHALAWVRENWKPAPEFVALLEPTAPLRKPEHVDQAIELLESSGADSVISVCEAPHVFNPAELLVIEKGELRPFDRSQTLDTRRLRGHQEPVYLPNGLVYAFRLEKVLTQKNLYGRKCMPLVLEWKYFLDVDEPEDLQLADVKLRGR
jgi:CMP-N,N'-diacetyllegionaminic acid synthase